MKKNTLIAVRVLALILFISTSINTIESQAAETPVTFSSYWYEDSSGWHVKDSQGNIIKDAWLCDDAVPENGNDIWYLLDSNGNMVSAGLVQDQTGNFYSLETNHNGYYGMLRYESGNYDGIELRLVSNHSGSFAAILNQEGIEALQLRYGLTVINIDNDNIVYTSSFEEEHSRDLNRTMQQIADITKDKGVENPSWLVEEGQPSYGNNDGSYYNEEGQFIPAEVAKANLEPGDCMECNGKIYVNDVMSGYVRYSRDVERLTEKDFIEARKHQFR